MVPVGFFAPSSGSVVPLYAEYHNFVGSACIVEHRDGRTYMATADHVVAAGAFECVHGQLRIEIRRPEVDLALVSVPSIVGVPWRLGPDPATGDPIRCIGYFSGVYCETFGHVASGAMRWLDCLVGPGMSGGATVDVTGRLIGIIRVTWMPGDMSLVSSALDLQELVADIGAEPPVGGDDWAEDEVTEEGVVP